MILLVPLSLSTLRFWGVSIYLLLPVCYCTLYFSLTRKWSESLFAHLHYFTSSIVLADLLSVCDEFGSWFCHLGISSFVCECLGGGSRLKIPPYFVLLKNPQVSVHYYLCLNAGIVFLSILSTFLLSQCCRLNLPVVCGN